jgi:hypothetical protein
MGEILYGLAGVAGHAAILADLQDEGDCSGQRQYTQTIATHLKARLVGEPRFEKDTEFLPLQAADLIAWHVRQHWLAHKSMEVLLLAGLVHAALED